MVTPRSRRRWYQFSIMSMLVVTAVAALLLARYVVPARRQHDAVEAITKLGGQVFYDYHVSGAKAPPGPAWLRGLIGDDFFQRVQSVTLSDDHFDSPEEVHAALVQVMRLPTIGYMHVSSRDGLNDATVGEIAELRSLKGLLVGHVKLSEEGLAQLSRLSDLSYLCLSGSFDEAGLAPLARLDKLAMLEITNVDEAVLRRLADLRRLKLLFIGGLTSTDGAGLAHLSELDQLTELTVEPVTDETLKQIASLRGLQKLKMRGSISPDAIASLLPLSKLEELTFNSGRITNALKSTTDLIYSDSSISDLLGYFKNKYDVKFQFDVEATALLKTYSAAPLLTDTAMAISLHDALDQLLTPHGLGYRIEPDKLVITTHAEAERARAGVNLLLEKLPNLKVIGW